MARAGNTAARRVAMVDLILGYRCNSNCMFCTSTTDLRAINMTTAEAIAKLDDAVAAHRPAKVRFGGGEPTIRKDLPALVAFARGLGVEVVTVQTNGYMLAYRDYLARLKDNGLSGVNISLRGAGRATVERLTGITGSHGHAAAAIDHVLALGLPLELDVLVTKPALAELPALTADLLSRGDVAINYWYVSIEGRAAEHPGALVPTMTAAARALARLFDMHPGARLRAFYVPYCFLPRHRERVWHPLRENTLVITPGDEFMLEKGRVDIGTKPARCRGCRLYRTCFGVRLNYLARFGDGEIRPLR